MAMSVCNVYPFKLASNPINTNGCAFKISCDASDGISPEEIISLLFSHCLAFKESCNAFLEAGDRLRQ